MTSENKKNKNTLWLILILLLCGVIILQHWKSQKMVVPFSNLSHEKTGHDLSTLSIYEKERLLQSLVENLYESNGSSVYNISIYRRYMGLIKKYFPSLETVQVLEIGPGSNLASGALLVLGGINKYYGVDIYKDPEFYNPLPFQSLSTLINQFIPELDRFPINRAFDFKNNQVVYNQERITYLYPYLSSSFPMDADTIDFIFSHSSFEHFITPEQTVVRIFEALKPGGITAHSIDLRYHQDFSRPYEFLKFDGKTWATKFNDKNMHLYTNRWRARDYIETFKNKGFEILEQTTQTEGKVTEADKKKFSHEFQKYTPEELAITYLFIVAKKPNNLSDKKKSIVNSPSRFSKKSVLTSGMIF